MKNSLYYKGIISAELLGKGGEAIIYRLEHVGVDEVVAKMPIFAKETPEKELL